jgi:hypothetical protein
VVVLPLVAQFFLTLGGFAIIGCSIIILTLVDFAIGCSIGYSNLVYHTLPFFNITCGFFGGGFILGSKSTSRIGFI